jgi:hypothetical protein
MEFSEAFVFVSSLKSYITPVTKAFGHQRDFKGRRMDKTADVVVVIVKSTSRTVNTVTMGIMEDVMATLYPHNVG